MVQQFRTLKESGIPQELAFSKAEYEARVAKVRKAMEEQDLDVLLVHHIPNFCYLTGFQTPLSSWYGCLILPREGEPIVQVTNIEIPNLMVHGWDNENIYVIDWQGQIDGPSQLASILKERGFGQKRIGLELRFPGCTGQIALQLHELLPGAQIKDASDLVLHFRAVKSPAEMAHIREAARLTDIGMEAGLTAAGPGKTDNDLLMASYAAMIGAGSEYLSIQPLVYAGAYTTLVHVTAKRRAMKVGDTATLELTGVYQRYSAPLFRTAVVGEPSDLIKRLAEYVKTRMALLCENARPGRSTSDLARAVAQGMKNFKLPEVPGRSIAAGGYGYSVGISFPPDWVEHSMFIDENHDRLLEERMVFHTPTGARSLGQVGVSFSETVVITATGSETLSKLPRELTVVPA